MRRPRKFKCVENANLGGESTNANANANTLKGAWLITLAELPVAASIDSDGE